MIKAKRYHCIESINARIRDSTPRVPSSQGNLMSGYSAPAGKGQQCWSNRWKAALNAFEITFDGFLSSGHK